MLSPEMLSQWVTFRQMRTPLQYSAMAGPWHNKPQGWSGVPGTSTARSIEAIEAK